MKVDYVIVKCEECGRLMTTGEETLSGGELVVFVEPCDCVEGEEEKEEEENRLKHLPGIRLLHKQNYGRKSDD